LNEVDFSDSVTDVSSSFNTLNSLFVSQKLISTLKSVYHDETNEFSWFNCKGTPTECVLSLCDFIY